MTKSFQEYAYFRGGEFLPFAHRGGSLRFPENTRAAFEGAMSLGFRHLETDVHSVPMVTWSYFMMPS